MTTTTACSGTCRSSEQGSGLPRRRQVAVVPTRRSPTRAACPYPPCRSEPGLARCARARCPGPGGPPCDGVQPAGARERHAGSTGDLARHRPHELPTRVRLRPVGRAGVQRPVVLPREQRRWQEVELQEGRAGHRHPVGSVRGRRLRRRVRRRRHDVHRGHLAREPLDRSQHRPGTELERRRRVRHQPRHRPAVAGRGQEGRAVRQLPGPAVLHAVGDVVHEVDRLRHDLHARRADHHR
jgi:hypothetical protein